MASSPRRSPVPTGPRVIPLGWPTVPRNGSSPDPAPKTDEARLEILRRAEALEIPWERILLDEIQSEKTLRRFTEDVAETPLETRLSLLSFTFLGSWRVRDQIQALSAAARGASLSSAIRQLRQVFHRLVGKPESARSAFVGHLWFGYQRILLLQRVCRVARRSRGTTAERMAFVCSTARCGFDDAAWALCREDSRRRGHALDAAMLKVREEGFHIPRATTETRAFVELRRILRASSRPERRQSRPSRPQAVVAVPPRVGLP